MGKLFTYATQIPNTGEDTSLKVESRNPRYRVLSTENYTEWRMFYTKRFTTGE
jgi:hypothetical protein